MVFTVRLNLKAVPFSGWRFYKWVGISRSEAKKRVGKLSFRYLNGNFKVSRTETTIKDRNVSTVGM